jgi:hypothetical protein
MKSKIVGTLLAASLLGNNITIAQADIANKSFDIVNCKTSNASVKINISYPKSEVELNGIKVTLNTLVKYGSFVESWRRNTSIRFTLSNENDISKFGVTFVDNDMPNSAKSDNVVVDDGTKVIGKLTCQYSFGNVSKIPARFMTNFFPFETGPITQAELDRRTQEGLDLDHASQLLSQLALRESIRSASPFVTQVDCSGGFGCTSTEYYRSGGQLTPIVSSTESSNTGFGVVTTTRYFVGTIHGPEVVYRQSCDSGFGCYVYREILR